MSFLSEEQQSYLRNPFYSALTTRQSHFGERIKNVLRYRPQVLPFASVEHQGEYVDAETLRRDTDADFCGVLPSIAPDTPDVLYASCLQMAWRPRSHFAIPTATEGECELGSADASAMVELTQVAFPGYFRAETCQLGRYIGIRVDGLLVAMAGHRTRMPGLREISGVCTRPGYTGRGYAQHLIQRLLMDQPDELPYLHVISTNTRAVQIYERLGFVTTAEVPFLKISQRP
ncbi:putative acyltransferase [Terriglobus roseus DSM 18391]|uniref:Putative acyltransferase n=1 Tax=Terriglobus roseus (strain DSM 18391 / NRRL B-41598 / KBS 63) TaxID=926566 RepID=I3ZDJ5_TERRK|nr:GNAT family N-acetyltransferase [Terriglobus roseus]AFL87313.1 putative acyltransferase [Terriglobus roseus DSM 18391]